MSVKEEAMEFEGTVLESLRNGKFLIELDTGSEVKHTLMGHVSGKMRKNFIRIVPGDRVKVEVSSYDMSVGRITYRNKT